MSTPNKKISLTVSGMHCASCANTIKRKVEKLNGVESCIVNYGTQKATVEFDPAKVTVAHMNHEVEKLGYALQTTEQSMSSTSHEHHSQESLDTTHLRQVSVVLFFVAVSFLVMAWEIGAEPLGLWPEMPELAMTFFHHLMPLFATYTLFVVGVPYLQSIVRFAKYRVANMDTLVGIGTLVAFLYSFVISAFEEPLSAFVNTQQTYYDVTIVVIGFISLGKYLEARSKSKTGEALEKLIGLQAKTAIVLRDGKQQEIPIEEVVIGDTLVVKPGQKIPVDGTILEGVTAIDESMITGESIPVDKKAGDIVIGSTLNKQGAIHITATKVGKDTVLSQIIDMVAEAQGSKAPIERLADQVSAIFVPVVLVFALVVLLSWLLIAPQFIPFSQAVPLALVSFVGILVIACPCAMGLATPTAVIVGVGKAAQHGILIKNAESLEKCARVTFVVMDKTGTLTKGKPAVTDIKPGAGYSEKKFLQLVASLEALSEHPLASAIVEKAKAAKLSLQKITTFRAIEGKGLQGTIDGTTYYAGNVQLARDISVPINEAAITELTAQGKTPIIVMTKKEVIGYIGVADTVKDDAARVVAELHRQGITVAMVTGDNKKTAQHIADQVGIDRVIAEVLPADKANQIKKLQQEGYRVAMVGDGINDAPALATADVGIAMGTGTDVAIESAGITLLGGRIAAVPKTIHLARATMKTIKQNLFWAFFYNVVGIPLAAGLLYPFFGILLNPAIAGAAMAFSSVSVVLNALKLKTVKL